MSIDISVMTFFICCILLVIVMFFKPKKTAKYVSKICTITNLSEKENGTNITIHSEFTDNIDYLDTSKESFFVGEEIIVVFLEHYDNEHLDSAQIISVLKNKNVV
ncbi:MAG: hypothetical protein RSE57_05290 [Clostridia bacterium]